MFPGEADALPRERYSEDKAHMAAEKNKDDSTFINVRGTYESENRQVRVGQHKNESHQRGNKSHQASKRKEPPSQQASNSHQNGKRKRATCVGIKDTRKAKE